MRFHKMLFVWALIPIIAINTAVEAQVDVVITKRKDSTQTVKRKGAIVEWLGMSLTLNSNGRVSEIDNEDIVEFQTTWNADYQSGLDELRTGKTQIAVIRFQEALETESRPWAKRIIRSKLVDALQSIEKHPLAVEHFLRIIRQDPQTRFVHLAPLPWTHSGNAMDASAEKWISSKDPLTQLIGASWLVGGPHQDKAIQTLQELSRDIDPNIKGLATAQLWRTRVNVNAKQVDVWQGIVDNMPRAIRAGPNLVLADAQSRAGQADQAIVNLMRIPILYPEQKSLSAAALYRTAGLLHNKGDAKQAQSILSELITHYPQTIWAQQATN